MNSNFNTGRYCVRIPDVLGTQRIIRPSVKEAKRNCDCLVLINHDWDWDKAGFANTRCPSETAQTVIISKYQGSKKPLDELTEMRNKHTLNNV